jgi:hypothetical protein
VWNLPVSIPRGLAYSAANRSGFLSLLPLGLCQRTLAWGHRLPGGLRLANIPIGNGPLSVGCHFSHLNFLVKK